MVDQEDYSGHWTDSDHDKNQYLTKIQAVKRAAVVSEVSYRLALAVNSGAEHFEGTLTASFKLSEVNSDVFIDFKGPRVNRLFINGKQVAPKKHANIFKGHKIQLPLEFLQVGKNTVKIDYTAEYVRDCQGMHYFKDSADQNEYLYTNCEPNHAHIWFPCFDQPDLKAPYELLVLAPESWMAVSNAPGELLDPMSAVKAQTSFMVTESMTAQYKSGHKVYRFDKSVPISTYLYCVIAGNYAEFTPSAKVADPQIPMKLYVRQSLKEQCALISEDWFRITKCGIRYYEKVFSTAYPFGKFD